MRPRLLLALTAALALSFAPPSFAGGDETPLTPQAIAKAAFPGTVLIVMGAEGGDGMSQGSGFFVAPGIVVTNFHVIKGATSGWVRVIGQETPYAVEGIVAFDRGRDLALLRVKGAPDVQPLPRGDSSALSVADQLFAVGNPRGLEGTFSEGILSSIRQRDGETMLQITTPISEGSSGGPVIDTYGRVVGVAVGMLKDGQNLNFAIPVSAVERLLGEMHAPIPLADLAPPPAALAMGPPARGPGPVGRDGRTALDCGTFTCRLPKGWKLEETNNAAAAFRASRAGGGNALLTVFFKENSKDDVDGFAGKAIATLGGTYLDHKLFVLGGERAYLIMYKTDVESGPIFASDVRVMHREVAYTISLWSDADATDMRAIGDDFDQLAKSWQWK